MRKLEGVVKEVVDEMGYLKKREERFQATNSVFPFCFLIYDSLTLVKCQQTTELRISHGLRSLRSFAWDYGRYSIYDPSSNESISLTEMYAFF
jgi:hypothetical protein